MRKPFFPGGGGNNLFGSEEGSEYYVTISEGKKDYG